MGELFTKNRRMRWGLRREKAATDEGRLRPLSLEPNPGLRALPGAGGGLLRDDFLGVLHLCEDRLGVVLEAVGIRGRIHETLEIVGSILELRLVACREQRQPNAEVRLRTVRLLRKDGLKCGQRLIGSARVQQHLGAIKLGFSLLRWVLLSSQILLKGSQSVIGLRGIRLDYEQTHRL